MRTVTALALSALLLLSSVTVGRRADEPDASSADRVVHGAWASYLGATEDARPDSVARMPAVLVHVDVATRPIVRLPANPPRVVVADATAPIATTGGPIVRGVASWYCGPSSRCTRGYPGGLYAAIRHDLLGHRGDKARVCGNGRCVTVTVVDCNCGPNANLIDLYSDAFRRLAPLSRGVLKVEVSWQ